MNNSSPPNYIYHKNKIGYRRSGELSQNEIDFLKSQVIHTIEKEKIYTPLLKETNKEIEELKKYFSPKEKNYLLRNKKDLILEEKILRLGQLLYKERYDNDSKIKYGSIKSKEIINLTKNIKNYLFSKNNDNFKLEYENFKESLNKINNYFYKINEDNNIKNIVVDTTLIDSKNKYMNNYIYNAIVNYANYNYKKETKNITKIKENDIIQYKGNLFFYVILFVIALGTVFKLIPYYILIFLVFIVVFFIQRNVLYKIDYALLFTFIGFFIFTGHIGSLPIANKYLASIVIGNEIGIGVLASQVISNVPSAILLSGFTDNYRALLYGVNVGGTGTLIASLASLITFRQYCAAVPGGTKKYMVRFTCFNVAFLVIMTVFCELIL